MTAGAVRARRVGAVRAVAGEPSGGLLQHPQAREQSGRRHRHGSLRPTPRQVHQPPSELHARRIRSPPPARSSAAATGPALARSRPATRPPPSAPPADPRRSPAAGPRPTARPAGAAPPPPRPRTVAPGDRDSWPPRRRSAVRRRSRRTTAPPVRRCGPPRGGRPRASPASGRPSPPRGRSHAPPGSRLQPGDDVHQSAHLVHMRGAGGDGRVRAENRGGGRQPHRHRGHRRAVGAADDEDGGQAVPDFGVAGEAAAVPLARVGAERPDGPVVDGEPHAGGRGVVADSLDERSDRGGKLHPVVVAEPPEGLGEGGRRSPAGGGTGAGGAAAVGLAEAPRRGAVRGPKVFRKSRRGLSMRCTIAPTRV